MHPSSREIAAGRERVALEPRVMQVLVALAQARGATVSRDRLGEVYWVTLDPVVGTEIRKTRPAVIVSNDSCNRYGTRVVVLPITSNVDLLFPGEALIAVKGKQGRALGDRIRSIDKSRLATRE